MGKAQFLGFFIILLAAMSVAGAVSIQNLEKLSLFETNLWDISWNIALSPDGTKIAYTAYDEFLNPQIFVINIDGSEKIKLTNDSLKKWGISWGMDRIVYVSFGKDGLEKIFVINPDGTDNRQLIPDNTRQGNSEENKPPAWAAPSWSPDGKSLIYTSLNEMADQKVYMVDADGTGKKLVFKDNFRQWSPSFSPDGKNIVYVSYNNRYREELFIVDIAGTARRQLTFDEINKNYPVWGPDGTIVYVSYENLTSSSEKLFAINQDGTNKRLFVGSDVDSDYKSLSKQRSPSFSLNGKKFVYAVLDPSGAVKIAIGDIAGVAATIAPTTPSSAVTPAPTLTPTATTTAIQTPVPTPKAEVTPPAGSALKDVILTMLLVLVIIVIVMLAVLIFSNILSKK